MKLNKIILTGLLATTLVGTSFAANTIENSNLVVFVNEDKTPKEIKVSELPEAVIEALKNETYAGWEAKKAWIVKKDDKKLYKVEVHNGEEKTTLLFDDKGVAIG